jgi:N6-L-threonylcarbamoyladenine synthase
MRLLSIETSCDETALALLLCFSKEGETTFTLLSEALYSQVKEHSPYGGVFPTLAKRAHGKNIIPLLTTLLSESSDLKKREVKKEWEKEDILFLENIFHHEEGLAEKVLSFVSVYEKPNIDAIAITIGPGLEPALWVGVNVAKALSFLWKMPLIGVNHLEGHLIASVVKEEKEEKEKKIYRLPHLSFPFVGLVISGGHSQFVYSKEWGVYKIIGNTRDDSVGEAFDKTARMLGLPYPGGPEIAYFADKNRKEEKILSILRPLPRPMKNSKDLDLSFSGIKTAVRYLIRDMGGENELKKRDKERIARDFEDSISEVLAYKAQKAIEMYKAQSFLLGGGVSANTHISTAIKDILNKNASSCTLYIPEKPLHTDNAIMIGMAGFLLYLRKENIYSYETLPSAQGNLSLE